jgi:hypothetical protein
MIATLSAINMEASNGGIEAELLELSSRYKHTT